MTRRALVDISQFMGRPIPSGVQRVLGHMAEWWDEDVVEARFGYLEGSAYVTTEAAVFAALVRDVFAHSGTVTESWAKERLRSRGSVVGLLDVPRLFGAYVLPEPAPRPDVVELLTSMLEENEVPVCGVAYDAFPVTSPWLFQGIDLRPYDRFFNVFSRIENMAFISEAVRVEFEDRLRRRPCRRGRVVPLGGDGLLEVPVEAAVDGSPTVVSVGSVEPRKRQALLVEAMDELWAQGSDLGLLLLGRPGTESKAFLDILRRRTKEGGPLRWLEEASDAVVAGALRRAAVMVFIGTDEGYGLPAVEALALGCPLIAAESLPALARLGGGGQVRMAEVDKGRLVDALRYVTDPANNGRLRQETASVEIPRWQDFGRQLTHWVAEVIEDS